MFKWLFGKRRKISEPSGLEVSASEESRAQADIAADQVVDWTDLLAMLKNMRDPLSARELHAHFPYQTLFATLIGKLGQPSYFAGVPFTPITDKIVESAKRYLQRPKAPALALAFGVGKDKTDKYVVMSDGHIGRQCLPELDAILIQVASCLPGGVSYNLRNPTDRERIAKAAYDAITHYKNIPVVHYFCVLPYLQKVMSAKRLSPNNADFLITTYNGVEGLLWEIYDELGEGGRITDEAIRQKVLQLLR